jgi:hypothetical protein
MAITITKPTSQVGDTANQATYPMSPSFLPAANAQFVVITNASATLLGSISGVGGISWQLVASMEPQAAGSAARIFTGYTDGAPSSASIVANFTGDNATGCTAIPLQLTGQEPYIRQIVQVQSVGANPQVTFPLPLDTNNAYITAVLFTSALGVFTPPSGWTTVSASYGTPTTGLAVAHRSTGVSTTTIVLSTGNISGLAAFGLEIWAQGNIPSLDPLGTQGIFGL